ncbi:MAG: hypothetical protein KY456_07750 [Chloroflexi bacterium]|nr:hypothetical protein [Chloroflexota bacterium]
MVTSAFTSTWWTDVLAIEGHCLIGDRATSALVGRDGISAWLSVPWFLAPMLSSGIPDWATGGVRAVAPADPAMLLAGTCCTRHRVVRA